MKHFLQRYGRTLLGVAIGALGGFLYWRFVGCSSGSCPITSSPSISTIWGALMGGLLFSSFKKDTKK
jgi:hypothetical protein